MIIHLILTKKMFILSLWHCHLPCNHEVCIKCYDYFDLEVWKLVIAI